MTVSNARLDGLREFYLAAGDDGRNLFQIWDDGGARGDSITPSTYSAEYRTWMFGKLIGELKRTNTGELLSLGCGNAAVEGEIVRGGYRVVGVDALDEAVELARAKGVEAVRADIDVWAPPGPMSLIYTDGLLGHLYLPGTGLQHSLKRIRSWLAPSGDADYAALVVSNDATNNGNPVQAAPGVSGFHWLSVDYLRDQALAAGFDQVEAEEFPYRRPLSGDRIRSVIVARVNA